MAPNNLCNIVFLRREFHKRVKRWFVPFLKTGSFYKLLNIYILQILRAFCVKTNREIFIALTQIYIILLNQPQTAIKRIII